jgi:hypothetical protein
MLSVSEAIGVWYRVVTDLVGCTGVWVVAELSFAKICFTFLSFFSWSLIWVCNWNII